MQLINAFAVWVITKTVRASPVNPTSMPAHRVAIMPPQAHLTVQLATRLFIELSIPTVPPASAFRDIMKMHLLLVSLAP
jgi:hypothetical protein